MTCQSPRRPYASQHYSTGDKVTAQGRINKYTKGTHVKHGVVSCYAAQALTQATTIESLVKLIDQRAKQDIKLGRIPGLCLPSLQILGIASLNLPGKPMSFSLWDFKPR